MLFNLFIICLVVGLSTTTPIDVSDNPPESKYMQVYHYVIGVITCIAALVKIWMCIKYREKICCYGCSCCRKAAKNTIASHETHEMQSLYVY